MADGHPPPPAGAGSSASVRDRKKDEVRTRILDAVLALMVEGGAELNHDAVAIRAGVGRRTVYRYFPDRQALMDATLLRVRQRAGPLVAMPKTMDELVDTLEPIYTGFDRIADIVTVIRSTPEGRLLRLAQRARRVEAYTQAAAEAVEALPPRDRVLATALLQMLHTTPWLEMRDNWGLTGEEIARAARWAVETLLEDLRRRGARPIGAPGAETAPED
jgi:AcrR family transcriptional regulator